MNYSDSKIASEKDYLLMKQSYDKIHANEISDLQEIVSKMENQKASLIENNIEGKYTYLIDKMESNIADIRKIISTTSSDRTHSFKAPEIPNFSKFLSDINARKMDLNDPSGAISPVRGHDEMMNFQNFNNNLDSNLGGSMPRETFDGVPQNRNETGSPTPSPANPTNPFIPNNETDSNNSENTRSPSPANPNNNNGLINPNNSSLNPNNIPYSPIDTTPSPSPASPNNTTTNSKRNSPMQGNIISNLIREINVSFGRSRRMSKVNIDYTHEPYRNKFHNVATLECRPHNRLVTNQIDIIRLLLLYLALRPNSKYISSLASITNEQFDMLMELEN